MRFPYKLRKYQHMDFDELSSWVDDRNMFAYWGGTWFEYPLRKEEFHEHHLEGSHIGYSVVDAHDSLIAYFEIRELEPKAGRLFRVIVKSQFRNQGIGKEMMREAMRIGFEEMDLDTVGLGVTSDNGSGKRCYEAAGFSRVSQKNSSIDLIQKESIVISMEISRMEWQGKIAQDPI